MVHHGHQHVLVVCRPKHLCPQGDLVGEVETVPCRLLDPLLQPVGRPTDSIDDFPAEFSLLGGNDQLLRRAVYRREQRAQALVAL